MLNALRAAVVAAAMLSFAAPCVAADAASVPEGKQTTLGLYLTSEEVPPFLAQRGGHALFVDVRAPEELAASGVASAVDADVPLFLLSGGDGKPRPNPDFVAQVQSRLAAKGLTKDDAVVVMCRTGRRSALAASLLAEFGFSHVYSVVDGYEGDAPGAGWKSKGLPWRPAGAATQPK
jgi:rhodanese-related sulfurtransferase